MEDKKKKRFCLDDIEKNEVFKVPPGYFERLPAQIQQKTQGSGKGVHLFRPKFALAILAVFCVLLSSWFFYYRSVMDWPARQLSEKGKRIEKSSHTEKTDKKEQLTTPSNSRLLAKAHPDSVKAKAPSRREMPVIASGKPEELLAGIDPMDILLYLNTTEDEETEDDEL